MKTITAIAVAAICGLTVLVSGCTEETPAEKAQKSINQAAKDTAKAAEAAQKDAAKKADAAVKDAKKAADAAKPAK